MFAYIEGRVTEKYADAMVVEAGGVGFLVSATPQTISSVSGSGARCRVYTKVVATTSGRSTALPRARSGRCSKS